jgi:opacity protein-like surface antigen
MRCWRWAGLLLVGTATAFAQLGELSISGGRSSMRNNSLGSIASTDAQGAAVNIDAEAKTNFRLGFRFTINSWTFLGHEIGYAYNHGKLSFKTTPSQEVSMPVHQGFYNFLAYATPEGSKVRPFAAGGVHFSTFYPPGTGVFSGNGVTKFGINYGGGLKVRLSEILMLRVDVRDYFQPKPDFGLANLQGWLHMLETSMGLGFVF